jgi:nicotinamidase-related amidase
MPRMIDHLHSVLVLVDFQERLLPAIGGGQRIVATADRLAEAAQILGVPILALEQSPKGLGPTVAALAKYADMISTKNMFDGCRTDSIRLSPHLQRPMAVVTGFETHVCVLQTTLGLLDLGKQVFVVRDAVGSRRLEDKIAALERMARHGAELVTSEMVVFEWLRNAEHPRFRELLQLVK